MRFFDPIPHASFDPLDPPCLFHRNVSLAWRGGSAIGKHAARLLSGVFSQKREPWLERYRGTRNRFSDVDLPFGIGCIGDVEANAGQAMSLLTIPCPRVAQAKPAASDQESLVSIDVKALLGGPTGRSAVGIEFGGGQLVPVGQDVALHFDSSIFGGVLGGRRCPWLGRMPSHEWVPRRDGLPV